MLPSINCTSERTIDRPSPVPPKRRVVEASAWENGAKISACCSGAMPIPVSRTSKHRLEAAAPAAAGAARTIRSTLPRSVNLIALASRLPSTWLIRSGSPSSTSGRSDAMDTPSGSPLASACTQAIATASSTRVRNRNGRRSRSSSPASILDRSSTSLTTPSSALPDRRILSSRSACPGSRAVLPSRWDRPITAWIGVRISWLMLARNADLALLASSAWRVCDWRSMLALSSSAVLTRSDCSTCSRLCTSACSRELLCDSRADSRSSASFRSTARATLCCDFAKANAASTTPGTDSAATSSSRGEARVPCTEDRGTIVTRLAADSITGHEMAIASDTPVNLRHHCPGSKSMGAGTPGASTAAASSRSRRGMLELASRMGAMPRGRTNSMYRMLPSRPAR